MKVRFFGDTNVGKVRTNNEDAFIVQNIWDEDHVLAVVIDGVGGYEGGEVASDLARKCIIEYLEQYSNGERLELLKQAVIYANNAIYSARKTLSQYSSMSCVLTAVLVEVKRRHINMAHVGDTRLYMFAENKLVKLSHDHSLVGFREEIGELTEEEAMRHPQRNVIGRDIGSAYLENSGNDYVEVATFPLLPESVLLLCSDGLCDMIMSVEMSEILRRPISVEEKVNGLIAAANDAGGKDNVTVVLVESGFDDTRTESEELSEPVEPENADTEKTTVIVSDVIEEEGCGKKKSKYIVWLILFATGFVLGFLVGGFTMNKDTLRKHSDIVSKESTVNSTTRDSIISQNDINQPCKEVKKLEIPEK